MAVPKRKTSKMKTRSRRASSYRLGRVTTTKCSNCGEPVLPHRVCKACGHYNSREVITVE